ncbi:MAG: MBL fold metallo-hydrolase [Candidatus Dormibacteraeota bacterium]|nr:MBL fold metallo-hydrolase [Candidatus Dormibacteraeota bacterium]
MAGHIEELSPGIYRIDAIRFANAINVLAISGEDGWTLVDTGLAGSPARIQAALAALGLGPPALARIYLTHHHQDHVAGLPGMRAWAPGAEIVAPEHDGDIIAGTRPPDSSSSRLFRLTQRWARLPVVPVSRQVREGDRIAGLRVIATPGHSAGHTSLIADEAGVLFTADAFGAMPRKLRVGVRKPFCADPVQALASAEKLLEEDYRTVVFSHGPVLREGARDRLRKVVAACPYAEPPGRG